MTEFSLVDAIRARVAGAHDGVALGIGDDAALLDLRAGEQLVACTDTMVDGVHFLAGTAPADIGWKSLAVNLSDLAAMGAEPRWALLALTLPAGDPRFVAEFADGFGELARLHAVALVGGDTTQGPLAVTVTALGVVAPGAALTRAGARVDDEVFVTGTLGDAAGALRAIRDTRHDRSNEVDARLVTSMRRPQPRVTAGLALRGVASACIDVSDGLLADLGHVCTASGVGAELEADQLPVSRALQAMFDADACRALALAGGDDYELCFTVQPERAPAVEDAFAPFGLRVTRIGRIVAGTGVRALDQAGRPVEVPHPGWEHFRR